MKGSTKIYHRPYLPPILGKNKNAPYVCRIAPASDGFEFEWFDSSSSGSHTLFFGKRGKDEKRTMLITDSVLKISGLETDTDYEFYIESADGKRSNTRLIRTGSLPDGTGVINYIHPDDTQYDFSGRFLCSPSLVRLPSGRILASMDLYGPEMPQNLTLIFYSEDDGSNWRYLCDLYPFYWGSLFYYKNVLYILGLTTEYGNLQIASSHDEGQSWSEPVTLFYGSSVLCKYGGIHRAPMNPTLFGGRLWTSAEYGCWKCGSHLPAVLSVKEDDEVMCRENWVLSDFLPYEGRWKAVGGKQGDTMEGNLIVLGDELYNLMRWKRCEILKMKINTSDPESTPEFSDIIPAPVSNSMFRVITHGDEFLLVTNRVTDLSLAHECWSYRNVLSLYKTCDFKTFEFIKDIINREECDPTKVGFQYPAFIKEGNTLMLAIRSAFNNADSFHNSNHILFYKTEV